MIIETCLQQEVTIVELAGRFDASVVESFKSTFMRLLDEGTRRFIINVREVNYVDSAGLGSLVSVLRRVQEKEGEIRLLEPSDNLRSLLTMTRLTRLFDIYDDLETAIAFGHGE